MFPSSTENYKPNHWMSSAPQSLLDSLSLITFFFKKSIRLSAFPNFFSIDSKMKVCLYSSLCS
jgi:hypothetical protein